MLSLFTYTHTNCSDVWPAYYGRLHTYFNSLPSFSMVNSDVILPYKNVVLKYDDNESYADEFIRCLQQIPFDFFIYMQEDFILYDYPKMKEIERCLTKLQDSNFSFVRLIKCGKVTDIEIDQNLFLISENEKSHSSPDSYSMQPTIWKKNDFISLYKSCNKPKFGEDIEYSYTMNKLNMNGLYYYNKEPKRIASDHYDSSIFPYIATAVVKKTWNYNQYRDELDSVFKEYNIDKMKRGFV
jgi:hypothetical protein